MDGYDLSIFQPDEWERYKRSLPESIESGPQSEYELRMMQRAAQSQEPSAFDKGLRVFQDVRSAAAGRPGPTMLERPPEQEPGRWEKVISPVADVVSVLGRGRVASREARLAREDLALRKKEQDIGLINSWFDMQQKMAEHIRGLPAEQQPEYFNEAASMLDELFPGAGNLFRHEGQQAGSMPDSYEHLAQMFPEINDIYATRGLEGLQDWQRDPKNAARLTEAMDAQALPDVSAWWSASEAWLEQHAPDVIQKVREDGITEIGEIPVLNAALPEQLRVPKEALPQLTQWLRRNAAIVPFVDEEKFAAEAKKERIKQEATTEGDIAKEARAAARKAADPVTQERQRLAEIRLKIGRGDTVTLAERAMLDEAARTDPLTALRREFVRGVVSPQLRENLAEKFAKDPDAKGWHIVEPGNPREKALVDAGLAVVTERDEGDPDRSLYWSEEEE